MRRQALVALGSLLVCAGFACKSLGRGRGDPATGSAGPPGPGAMTPPTKAPGDPSGPMAMTPVGNPPAPGMPMPMPMPMPMVSADAAATATTSRVTVTFDEQMRRRLAWRTGDKASIVAFDAGVQPGIRVGGSDVADFKLDAARTMVRRADDPELGPGQETLAVGVAERAADGTKIERTVRVFLPDRHPDAAVVRSTFRNAGQASIHVDRVYAERLLLDRKLAEPAQASHAFASYQGAAYAWGRDYAVIPLTPGFKQSNFLGQDDIKGAEGVGGGMPLVDLWGRTMGVAVAHLETGPRWVSLPVEVRGDGRVDVGVLEAPQARLGQKESLAPGDTYETVTTAVIFHEGDFYGALSGYGELLRARGVAIPRESPLSAHEPYWKSWGFRKDVTVDKFMSKLPELEAMGIRTANLDDGWYDFAGDWQPNRATGKFPGGDADMVKFVQGVHAKGFRTSIWWYPLGVSPDSRLAREHSDLLVKDEAGRPTTDIDGLYQLCPAHEPSRKQIRDVLARMVTQYGFDGVYLDFQGQSAVPPCFNPAHHHPTPLAGFETLPKVFEEIHADLLRQRPDPYLEVCICGLPHSPFYMPFYFLATTSDPRANVQVRRRIKAEKAIRGPKFAVGDGYVVPGQEFKGTGLRETFEDGIGAGAQATTFFAELDARQRGLWERWFKEYRAQGPGTGEYLNLYDLAFDLPEAHVVRRGADLYYGFFADRWAATQKIELRGLDPGKRYEVYDYGRGRSLGEVAGASPSLNAEFQGSLLLRVHPL